MSVVALPRCLRHAALAVPALAVTMATSRTAHTQGADGAAALALFEDGKRLTNEGDYEHGCPKLLASYSLVQKLGTLLNLADCYERSGRTASAWVRFTEAATIAERAGQQERVEFARTHAAALAPRLSRVIITVVAPAPEGLVVRRDGTVVATAAFGTAVPVDPGPHTIDASAPHCQTWTTSVVVALDTREQQVAIPVLVAEPETAVIVPLPVVASSVEATHEPLVTPSRSPQHTWALVAGGIGLGGLAASLVVGALASRRYGESNTAGGCVNDRCTSRGLEDRSSASSLAAGATGLAVGGAVLVGAGAVLYLTAPSARTTVSVGPATVTVGRAW